MVYTNACKDGIGVILTQNGHVTNYESRNIKEHEENYDMHDLELATIVHVLKMWKNYLMGRKYELRMNYHGLKYLFEQQNMNARKARWLEFLCEFYFDIKHVKGKENRVVDALNRKIYAMHATIVSTCKSYSKIRILEAFILDGYYL